MRRASGADAADLIELSLLFGDDETLASTDIESVRKALSKHPTEEVYVAELGGRIVGYAALQVTTSFNAVRPTAELSGIFVRQENRRNGAGSGLIREIVMRCRELDVLELFLRVNIQKHGAIEFYRRNGLAEADHFEYRIKYYE